MSKNKYVEQANRISRQIDSCLQGKEREIHSAFLKDMKHYLANSCLFCQIQNTKKCDICHGQVPAMPTLSNAIKNHAENDFETQELLGAYAETVGSSMANLFAVGGTVSYKGVECEVIYFEGNKVLIVKDAVDIIVSAHELEEVKYLDSELPLFTDGTWKQKRYAKHLRCATLYWKADKNTLKLLEESSAIEIIRKLKGKFDSKYDAIRARFGKASFAR